MSRSLFLLALIFAASALALTSQRARGQATAAADNAPIYLDEPESPPKPVEVTRGKVQDKYEDGKVRIEREVIKLSDDQLVNNGQFTEYYPSGKKFAEGKYDHGVHDGSWSFWFDNGQLCKTVTFREGRPEGAWEVFRDDGTLLAKRSYKDNKRDGDWVTYYEDGKTPHVEETFVAGSREGVSKAYFANGKVQREVNFKNNELDGPMTEWDEAGRKIGEAGFKAGKRHGKYIIYKADGTTFEQMYENGRPVK